MKFEIGKRVITRADRDRVEDLVVRQFAFISKTAEQRPGAIVVESINPTFGSIQRRDETIVKIRPTEDGYFIVCLTNYEPSVFFWLFVVGGLFGYFLGSLIPVGIYLYHRHIVRSAIEDVLSRIESELRQTPRPTEQVSIADEISKLAALKQSGLLTEEEFAAKKHQLLRL